jgi:hypothetical protein
MPLESATYGVVSNEAAELPPEMGGRRDNLSVDPRKTCPPRLCRCAGRPSSAAPDLTCSVSIACERTNYKGPDGFLNAVTFPALTRWARPRRKDDPLERARLDDRGGHVVVASRHAYSTPQRPGTACVAMWSGSSRLLANLHI